MSTTTKNKFRPDRLLKLAEHLESGKLGHDVFDFSTVNDVDDGETPKRNGCGTRGCAMGELPILFPKKWHFTKGGYVRLRDVDSGSAFEASADFFGITQMNSSMLFGGSAISEPWNRKPLGVDATRKQVAASIRRFVAWKQKQLADPK